MSPSLTRRVRRARRRVRTWWRETPPTEVGQTLMGIGLVLIVVSALLVFTLLR